MGKPVDTIAAAFVAHVEETLEAVTSVITAPYLEYFDIRFEIPPDFEFPSEDVENVVTQYRELKFKIVNVAHDMGDAIDEDRAKDLRGKRNYYSSFLSKHAVNRYEDKVREHSTLMIKLEHSVTTEVLQVLGFIAFRQRTRDKWMVSLSDLVLNLVIVQLFANAKNAPLLMNIRITCSTVSYLLLKSKTVMMRLSMRFSPCLNMLPNPFHFRNMVICEVPLEMMRTPDGLSHQGIKYKTSVS